MPSSVEAQQVSLDGASGRALPRSREAVAGVDAVYTDVWASMGEESELPARKQIFTPYQVNAALMARAAKQAHVHALPAGASRRRSHRRGLRVAGIGRLRSGRESAARAEGAAAHAARQRDEIGMPRRLPDGGSGLSRNLRTMDWVCFARCPIDRGSRTTTPTSPTASSPTPTRRWSISLTISRRNTATARRCCSRAARVSYRQLSAASTAFAAALIGLGVRPGDRVALLLPNCPQFLICEFGIWKAGGVVVALNPTYSERELEQALDAMRVSVAIVPDAVLRTPEARAGAHGRATRHRDIDQGVPAAPPARAVHAGSRRRRTDIASPCTPVTCGCRICFALTAMHQIRRCDHRLTIGQ